MTFSPRAGKLSVMGVRISHDRYGIPAKLDDAAVHGGGSGAELFVVEGDSAAASVSRVRDPRFQAVLPMQGKPLNAVKASRKKVVSHAFFGPLIAALGTGIDADFRLGGLRYDRVLLLMDPDADGIHCGVLMLLFFHRWMRPLLEDDRIGIVRAPWGEVSVAGDPTVHLARSEPELTALAGRLQESGATTIRRYRGLAGIDPAMIRDTCVVPATRRAERVGVAEVEAMIAMLAGIEPE
jgi:DNA gyrase subunit B